MALTLWETPLCQEPDDCVGVHSSSATGAIVPPAAAIWSLNASRILGSEEVLGSISEMVSMVIVRRFALWREPIIE